MNLPRGYTYTWPGWRRTLKACAVTLPILSFIALHKCVDWFHFEVSNRVALWFDDREAQLDDWLNKVNK